MIEFLDEVVFGVKEAAWPLIRNDLMLDYQQVGLLLSVPNLIGNLIEPIIGILGDTWRRQLMILGGGVIFSLTLILTASSYRFWLILFSFILFYPASGAYVSLTQATLMDAEPERQEHNMARWTFVGSLGIVLGPLFLTGVSFLGLSWRTLYWSFAVLSLIPLLLASRKPLFSVYNGETTGVKTASILNGLRLGLINAWNALRRREVLRWLILLEFADLTLDVFHGFLALYFVDVVEVIPEKVGLAVAIWTGAGLLGDFLLIPLLEKVRGLAYLRVSAMLVLVIFPAFLIIHGVIWKLILAGLLGFLNAGWYAIPKGQLYSVMPNQSGTVMTIGNVFGFMGSLLPLGIGIVAQKYGLQSAMWLIMLGPIAMIIGIGKRQNV